MKKFLSLFFMVGMSWGQTATMTPTFTPTPLNTPINRTGYLKITVPGAAAHPVSAIQQTDILGLSSAVSTDTVYSVSQNIPMLTLFPPGANPWITLGFPNQPNNETTIFGRMESVPTPLNRSGGLVGTGYWVIDMDGGTIFNPIPISYEGGTGSGLGWSVMDHDMINRFATMRAYLDPAVTDEGVGLNLFKGAGIHGVPTPSSPSDAVPMSYVTSALGSYVPYLNATSDLNMNGYGITAGHMIGNAGITVVEASNSCVTFGSNLMTTTINGSHVTVPTPSAIGDALAWGTGASFGLNPVRGVPTPAYADSAVNKTYADACVPTAVATANAFSTNLAATMTPLAANAVATEVVARQTACQVAVVTAVVTVAAGYVPLSGSEGVTMGANYLGLPVTTANKNIATNYLYDRLTGNVIAKTFSSLWNGSAWVAETNSFALGANSGFNNTGANFTGSGAYSGYNNTGANFTSAGSYSGVNNTGANFTGAGANSGFNNTGANFTGAGDNSGYNNIGANFTGAGDNSGYNNTGANFTGAGAYSGYNNTGANFTSAGVSAGFYNTGTGNTSCGIQSNTTFKTNVGGAKTFGYTNISGNTVTITGHGFGGNGEWHNVLYTQGTSPVTGLTNATIYQIYIVSSSVISFLQSGHGTAITNPGTGTGHTLTPQFEYTNITTLGGTSEPTASNQVMLGNTAVTQAFTYGSYTTPKNFISTNTTQYVTIGAVTIGMKGNTLYSYNGTVMPTPIP